MTAIDSFHRRSPHWLVLREIACSDEPASHRCASTRWSSLRTTALHLSDDLSGNRSLVESGCAVSGNEPKRRSKLRLHEARASRDRFSAGKKSGCACVLSNQLDLSCDRAGERRIDDESIRCEANRGCHHPLERHRAVFRESCCETRNDTRNTR